MKYEKLLNKRVHVAFKLSSGQKDAQGLMVMVGTLIEASSDYICLQVADGGGIDRYIPHDMIAFIDKPSDITRVSAIISS